MRKRVVLHVGLHKTGTTAIQVFARMNAARLGDRGWLYPETGRPKEHPFGQHLLAWSLVTSAGYLPRLASVDRARLEDPSGDKLWKSLEEEIESKSCDSCLLSSEEFGVLSADEIAALRDRLAPFSLKIVVYIRRQDELIESAYATSVLHSGDLRTIEEYLLNQRIPLDFERLISDWVRVFERENVSVHLYGARSNRGDVIDDFFSCIGLDIAGFRRPDPRINSRLPRYAIDVVRALRKQGISNEDFARVKMALEAASRNDDSSLSARFLSFESRRRLLDAHAASNERVRLEYFPERESLFDPLPEETPDPETSDHIQDSALSAIVSLSKLVTKP